MPRFNGDVIFVDGSGQVRSTNGDLVLRADGKPTNGIVQADVIVGSGKHFRPEHDGKVLGSGMDCGSNAKRWRMIWGISGVFNTRPYIQDLGAYVAVSSDIVAPVPTVTSLNALTLDLTLKSHNTAISVTDNGSDTIFFEGKLPVDFRTVSGSIIPDTDSAYGLGTAAKAWSALYTNIDVDASDDRPAMNGSGIATLNDMVFCATAQVTNFGFGLTTLFFSQDGLIMAPYCPTVSRRCKIAPRFGMMVQHVHGSTPSEWQCLVIKKKKSDNSEVHAASGWFSWNSSILQNRQTGGIFETNPAEKTFEPGDGYYIMIHNDGSGTAVNQLLARATIEFNVQEAGGGLTYFELE